MIYLLKRSAVVAALCGLSLVCGVSAVTSAAEPFPAGAGSMLEAQSAYARGDYNRAAALLQELVSREGQNAVAWLRLGRALGQRGAFEDAWRAYDRAIELTTPWVDDPEARAIELEARRARAAIAIEVGLEDVATARALAADQKVAMDLRQLEEHLMLARDGRVAAVPANATPVRARGRVINTNSTPKAAIQVIEGNTKPATAKPVSSASKQ